MLSVGRETSVEEETIVCRECLWEGRGSLLQTGFVLIGSRQIHLYAYRCPACGSFDLSIKGRLLPFVRPDASAEAAEETSLTIVSPQNIKNGNQQKKYSR